MLGITIFISLLPSFQIILWGYEKSRGFSEN
nr:MAG TPA: hypothetical protein [Caudoviricetes sp.]